jgi:hypothetical protein
MDSIKIRITTIYQGSIAPTNLENHGIFNGSDIVLQPKSYLNKFKSSH